MSEQDRSMGPSFTTFRRWSMGLNLAITLVAALAIVVMVNYLASRHFKRMAWSLKAQVGLTELTQRVLEGVTNDVRVTIFFDRDQPLYDPVSDLLREYEYHNSRIRVETLDYIRDPARAQLVKAQYKLSHVNDKDLVIFECNGRSKMVYENELSELDISQLVSGQSREVRRTGFKGEMLFTSAIMNVTTLRSLKAYFLEGHREHSPEDNDADKGFSKFAAVLKANNIDWARLTLVGTNEVPADCNLLVVAGPATPLAPEELAKLRRFLENGGRLMALFNFYGVQKNDGLRELMLEWGVTVGDDLVQDAPNSTSMRQDIIVGEYGVHPITRPLVETRLHLLVPRSVRPTPDRSPGADAPTVTELFFTGPQGTLITDIRDGVPYPHPATDLQTNICLAVAVEKGKIRDVNVDRGTSRLVVVGDTFFLNNRMIDSAANRDYLALAINWLLDRTELLAGLGPRPITEYQLSITKSHMTGLTLGLLVGLPGVLLLVGAAVMTRRRR